MPRIQIYLTDDALATIDDLAAEHAEGNRSKWIARAATRAPTASEAQARKAAADRLERLERELSVLREDLGL